MALIKTAFLSRPVVPEYNMPSEAVPSEAVPGATELFVGDETTIQVTFLTLPHRQVPAGSTTSLMLHIYDSAGISNVVADTPPTLSIVNPRGQIVVAGAASTALGGGRYYYNYLTQPSTVTGDYKAVFDYAIDATPLRSIMVFEVV